VDAPVPFRIETVLGGRQIGQRGERLEGLLQPILRGQLGQQPVAQRRQVVRVHLRVEELVRRQRARRPVGPLEALFGANAKLVGQDIPQPDRLPATDPRGEHRVENRGEGELEIALQGHHVVFGGVKDDLDGRVGQQGAQRAQIVDRQRIDDVVLVAGGELDQAHLLIIGVQAVGFGVDGQQRVGLQFVDQAHQVASMANRASRFQARRSRSHNHPLWRK